MAGKKGRRLQVVTRKEIAEAFNISISTVNNLISRNDSFPRPVNKTKPELYIRRDVAHWMHERQGYPLVTLNKHGRPMSTNPPNPLPAQIRAIRDTTVKDHIVHYLAHNSGKASFSEISNYVKQLTGVSLYKARNLVAGEIGCDRKRVFKNLGWGMWGLAKVPGHLKTALRVYRKEVVV